MKIKLKSLLLEKNTFGDHELIRPNRIPRLLYHATFEELVNSILKSGLVPAKNAIQNFAETDNRFVYLASSKDGASRIIQDLYNNSNSPRLRKLSGKVNVLTIDTSNLKKSLFYDDPYTPLLRTTSYMYMGKISPNNIIDFGD
jgi:hypothetical protein